MKHILWRAAVITTLCSLVVWALGHYIHRSAYYLALPLYGVALSWVIRDLIEEGWLGLRDAAMKPLSGRYYVYRGTRIEVLEDENHARWIPIAQVGKLLGTTTHDHLLQKTYGPGWAAFGKRGLGHLRDDALLVHLATLSSHSANHFRHWVERNVAYPARTRRERMGVRLEPLPDAVLLAAAPARPAAEFDRPAPRGELP